MSDKKMSITLDLVPYEVAREGDYLVIKDCAGSILANLEKPKRLGWNECYGAWIGEKFVCVSYEDGECQFETHDLEAISDWIDTKFDAISEIGYECLEDLN